MSSSIIIRSAERHDCLALINLKKELSIHSGMENKPMLSYQELERDGFDMVPPSFHCIVAEEEETGNVIGFGLYFYAYAAWEGKVLHLEDFCVSKSCRGQGVGSKILKALAKIAVRDNCSRIQLEVLEHNATALNFYNKHHGTDTTESMGWHNWRFDKEAITKLAQSS